MSVISKRRFIKRISIATLKLCLIGSIIIFIVLPFIYKYSPVLQRGVLFLTFIAHPSTSVLKSPADLGLYATRNFYIKYRDNVEDKNVTLGVWHILPNYIAQKFAKELGVKKSDVKPSNKTKHHLVKYDQSIEAIESQIRNEFPTITEQNNVEFYERMLHVAGAKIVFYMHGNSGSRAASHRIELYQVLREQGYHVICFDYRGYGDSLPASPTETGLVNDAIAVYKYITSVTTNPIFAWGHSLGTGVGCHTLAKLKQLNIFGPRVLVLESPFNNIRDEVREHPFSRFFRHLPWFDYTIVDPMFENKLRFESDKHVSTFPQPLMILHAVDDLVVPYKLGHKLYLWALDKRHKSWGPVEFHRFDADSGYGHKFICRAPELPDIFNKFFETYGNEIY
ncbi:lysophosphatidylserine lipase ABHD12 isoform X2 [Sitodiplosis mosellana]|uniref:lysophosphatidylserine lipase ABHD12 isoform X2 n=1 Tax=Sitodiplosis mosellana TaxID=263140 RepID=UPI002444574E|nr:lysophosphatidylserine lipase ABHD12 isoform X2 [Sitodiplosis mosellana]